MINTTVVSKINVKFVMLSGAWPIYRSACPSGNKLACPARMHLECRCRSYASRVPLPLRLSAVLCVAAAAILLLSAADFHRVPDGRSFCWFMNVMPVFCFPSLRQRPLIMRSDSELLIFCFRSEKRMGVFYAVRLCKI